MSYGEPNPSQPPPGAREVPGSATYPVPTVFQQSSPQGPVASAAHELTGLARVVNLFRMEQLLAVALIGALGYLMYVGPRTITEINANNVLANQEERQRDRELSRERDEKFLKATRDEFEHNRQSHEGQWKSVRDAQAEMVKLLITSLNKLAADMARLEGAITDLKRKINPSEIDTAPPPHPKAIG